MKAHSRLLLFAALLGLTACGPDCDCPWYSTECTDSPHPPDCEEESSEDDGAARTGTAEDGVSRLCAPPCEPAKRCEDGAAGLCWRYCACPPQ